MSNIFQDADRCLWCWSMSVRCGQEAELDMDGQNSTACTDQSMPPGGNSDIGEDTEADDIMHGTRSIYLLIVVGGVIALPAVTVVRICWARKLQKARRRIYREVEDGAETDGRGVDIFAISHGAIVPCTSPPSYEQSVADPDLGKPPAYDDLPPVYAEIRRTGKHTTSGNHGNTP
ncbi:hypothetical protein MAR_011216 [Mya arenaria]|uniref:Uncharacterized protein n=1 Tax=Mya arenaria TaxID=6604 RepID=A0ABY7FWT1_MYAAR|nr:hypothetical protein MAR_011216 [Mya arenaria]